MPDHFMNCLCCGKGVSISEEPFEVSPSNPSGGLFFKSFGGYGSTVFDPTHVASAGAPQEFLRVLICDQCIEDRAERAVWIKHTEVVIDRKKLAGLTLKDYLEEDSLL
jgi:hypothetical protein